MRHLKTAATALCVCILLSLATPFAAAVDFPYVKAASAVLADMDSGIILYEKNMNERRSPASLTKIMTGLLAVEALERGDVALDDVIAAPRDCWEGMDLDSSNAEILPGEELTFKDYLYCAMVKSANEACNVIAVAVDGSIQAFVNHMNLRANELGARNTFFSDTNGLSNENHYTTAYDLFLITNEAMKHEIFVDAVNTIDYEIEATDMHEKRYLNSSNALLCQDGAYGDGYLYLPASGVKTGYTKAAGYCLVSTAEKDGKRLLAVVLGCGGVLNTGEDGYGNFQATINMYDWGFKNFQFVTVLAAGETLNRAPVKYAKDNRTAELKSAGEIRLLLPKDIDENRIGIKIELMENRLAAPIKTGATLGTATVTVDGKKYAEVRLYCAEDIDADVKQLMLAKAVELLSEPGPRYTVLAVISLIAIIVIVIIRFESGKKRHAREISEAEERRRYEQEQQRRQESTEADRLRVVQYRKELENSEREEKDNGT